MIQQISVISGWPVSLDIRQVSRFVNSDIPFLRKQKEDKSYEGYYAEYSGMYTALLKSIKINHNQTITAI